jgi:hypothetical protein
VFSIKLDFDKAKFEKQLQEGVINAAKEGIQRRAASVRCPTHGETAKLEFINSSGSQLTYNIHGCCEPAIEAVKAALRD